MRKALALIAINFLIVGFLIGIGSWTSMVAGALIGFILLKYLKEEEKW